MKYTKELWDGNVSPFRLELFLLFSIRILQNVTLFCSTIPPKPPQTLQLLTMLSSLRNPSTPQPLHFQPRLPIEFKPCWLALMVTVFWLGQGIAAEGSDSDPYLPAEPSTPPELFGQTIRETRKLSSQEEKASFHLPDGFEIELVAAEPTIAKPMNMAFDRLGRLWVTQSTQYPFPAKPGEKANDSVVVLEDKDKNGTFESSKVFADGLNIPIGIVPYGEGVICFSIPNIWYLRDTDGDGLCDDRKVLLGPFDTSRDTHGMVNALRDGGDGWIYACHGFNNESRVQGSDGHVVAMTSGNTFRFKPDGSRVEQYTQGQVNPFGMAQDAWGFWYAADCHSKPISQLIAGGCYPSFGRADDGLGFVPPMMDHLHGSTAISGLAHTQYSTFPVGFENNFVSGNVMTCRINRNRLDYSGATAKAVAMPDLLTSDDPWFRPVDLQFGPDGNLYIADFYNKIIGHYEVPLDHPDRDRTSGRIWRIRWNGSGNTIKPTVLQGLTRNDRPRLDVLASLKPIEAKRRIDLASSWLDANDRNRRFTVAEHESILRFAATLSADRSEHAMLLQSIAQLISRNSEVGTEFAQSLYATWLLNLMDRIDSNRDPVLSQTVRIALRSCLTNMRNADESQFQVWLKQASQDMIHSSRPFAIDTPKCDGLVRVLLTVKSPLASSAVLDLVEKQLNTAGTGGMDSILDRLAETVDESNLDRLFLLIDRVSGDLFVNSERVLRVANRQKKQLGKIMDRVLVLGQKRIQQLSEAWLADAEKQKQIAPDWVMIEWMGEVAGSGDAAIWGAEKRELSNADASGARIHGSFNSSFTLGEKYVGTWKSAPFVAPKELDFYVVGHNGKPDEKDLNKNFVRLVMLDASGEIISELESATPPRSDVAKHVVWRLNENAGKLVQIQVIDGDLNESYAWIGVGEFGLDGMNSNSLRDRWLSIQEFIELFGWPSDAKQSSSLEALLSTGMVDSTCKWKLQGLRFKRSQPVLVELIDFAVKQNWLELVSEHQITIGGNWNDVTDQQQASLASRIAKRCSAKQQELLVKQLSRHRDALSILIDLCKNGSLSREALMVLQPSFWQSLQGPNAELLLAMRPAERSDSSRLAVVDSKAAIVQSATIDLDVGRKQFAERCANCHKLRDQGRVVGPQLEGVGARGVARLCEDILWPDRNVDEAFRMTLFVLEGGESVSGLVTDRTAESLTLTDQTGKPRRVLIAEIEQEKPSKLSLMPGNFDETMSNQELASLIGYLRKEAGQTSVTNE